MGICKDTAVPLLVANYATPGVTEVTETQVHPSRPELGMRVMRRAERLLIERDDCSLFKVPIIIIITTTIIITSTTTTTTTLISPCAHDYMTRLLPLQPTCFN
jgi:hypothetical protein